MNNLQEKDPEFYQFLKENDQELLDFGEDLDDLDDDIDGQEVIYHSLTQSVTHSLTHLCNHSLAYLLTLVDTQDDDDDMQDGDDDDEGQEEVYDKKKSKKSKRSSKDMVEIDSHLLTATVKKATDKKGDGNFTALKKLLSMFRSACIPSGATSREDEDGDEPTSNFIITSPEAYEQVMVACLENAYITMYRILDIKKDNITTENLSQLREHPKLKKIQLQILSFFKSILHTLGTATYPPNHSLTHSLTHTLVGLHDADAISKQGRVCVYLISSLEPYIPLLAPLPRLAKGVLKVLLKFWASGIAPADDTANVRGHAFLRIRQMAITLPGSMTEECYRVIYLTYARQCKSFSEINSTSVLFMAQCITELYSYNIPLAYQQSFLYIRQLALHLRGAILKKRYSFNH